jgi:peptidyl-prolyl cis-trans isomerase A (cyclophilin A)
MANAGAGTARADFFILVSDQPGLDANGPGGDATGFAAFGHVIEGMDVVKKIWESPVSQTKGEGPMKGQMLEPTIRIVKASRLGGGK